MFTPSISALERQKGRKREREVSFGECRSSRPIIVRYVFKIMIKLAARRWKGPSCLWTHNASVPTSSVLDTLAYILTLTQFFPPSIPGIGLAVSFFFQCFIYNLHPTKLSWFFCMVKNVLDSAFLEQLYLKHSVSISILINYRMV